jgi:hypothetical protein
MLPNDVAPDADVTLFYDTISADLCNLFDGCYELMLQVLGRLFAAGDESPEMLSAYADIGVSLMFDAIDPLGRAITRMPAGTSHPGMNAGPGFRLSRSAGVPPHAVSARMLFRERLEELHRYCRFVQLQPRTPAAVAPVATALEGYLARLL